ncbi:MAG: hypothetical protein ACRECC_12765 [Pseudolabrys sp.]
MRSIRCICVIAALSLAGTASFAVAQQKQLAPMAPYKTVAIVPPKPLNDPAFEAFRKQVGDVARKRDRKALTKLVAAHGFFWDRPGGPRAADSKSAGIETLSAALGLANPEAAGWDMLAGYSDDPTASASPQHKGALCAPADPEFKAKELDALLASTRTDVSEWGYLLAPDTEVRATPQPNAPVIEKLGLYFVRVMPDTSPAAAVAAMLRIVMPSGKTGYIVGDAIAPIGNDQVCYVKEGGAWKIAGYIGGGDQ